MRFRPALALLLAALTASLQGCQSPPAAQTPTALASFAPPPPQVGQLKGVIAPHLGREIKFGRHRPDPNSVKLRFRDYLKAALPTPPASVDYTSKATAALASIYLNDSLGDCVIAGGYHYLGGITGNADGGQPFVATNAQITSDYTAIGGYVPGNPSTDQGCDEQTALNYWQSNGFANGVKLNCWMAVDATNQVEVQQALYLFENLFFGVDLPDAWISPFPSSSGFTWGVAGAADQNNGHCFVGLGYDATGIKIDSWGLLGTVTYQAVAQYAASANGGELYVLVSDAMLIKATAKAPNGLDWPTLAADADAFGANIPVPSPTPAPPSPVPTPPSPAPAPVPGLITIDPMNRVMAVPDPSKWILIAPPATSSSPKRKKAG